LNSARAARSVKLRFAVTSQKLQARGLQVFSGRRYFFVYCSVTQWSNIYDFFLKTRFGFAEKKPKS
jgi:hypothetical protein